MRIRWFQIVFLLLVFGGTAGAMACAATDEIRELRAQVASLTGLVEQLSGRLALLENRAGAPGAVGPVPAVTSLPVATRPSSGTGGGYQNMNPDISVAGVAIGKWSDDKRDPERNTIGLEASEVVFTKNISPYSRGNLTLGFHGDHAEVEEGFIDVAHVLPGRLEARIGKFLVPTGVLNTIHPHDWPMVARPLVLEEFMGSDGLNEHGLTLSTPIDLQSKTYLKAGFDVLSGKNTALFNNGQTRVLGGRMQSNTPLNARDDLNVGMNYHQGAWNARGDLSSRLLGADVMWRRRFGQFSRLALWGEWLQNQRERLGMGDLTARGYYLNALYSFKRDRNWHVGVAYDCTEKPTDVRLNLIGKSAYVGYWLTENDRLQLQYRHKRDPFRGVSNNELLIEMIWGMGPHKPHLANF